MDNTARMPVSVVLLLAAVAVYALFGSPTPDNPAWPELVIGGLLIISVGTAGFFRAIDWCGVQNRFLLSIQILFLSGLVIGTIVGVYNGNDRGLILRDLLAFSFLALPLFLAKSFRHSDRAVNYFCAALVFSGLCFSLRTVMPAFNIWIPQGELLYLSNSPLVLFTAVYLTGFAWSRTENTSVRNFLWAMAALAGLALILAAMLLDVQRATIGAVMLSLVILALFRLVRAPRKALPPILIFAVLIYAFYPAADEALQAMAQKTAHVGLNMRLQEAESVFAFLRSNTLTLLVGAGWGAVFSSPAVGGLDVNYTHSLLTTLALKGGIVLLALGAVMTLAGIAQIFLIFQGDRVRGLALLWPFVIPVFLYASHKSFDFGLILLLISVWSIHAQTLHSGGSSAKKIEPLT